MSHQLLRTWTGESDADPRAPGAKSPGLRARQPSLDLAVSVSGSATLGRSQTLHWFAYGYNNIYFRGLLGGLNDIVYKLLAQHRTGLYIAIIQYIISWAPRQRWVCVCLLLVDLPFISWDSILSFLLWYYFSLKCWARFQSLPTSIQNDTYGNLTEAF